MDSENMQRISLYLDRELVTQALESLMANNALQDNDILGDKLAESVLKLSEDNAKAISKGLFRYAVQLEMVMRVLAELAEYTPEQIEEMRREAINNVRRTRGKVKLEDILAGYYDD